MKANADIHAGERGHRQRARALLIALIWLAALATAATLLFRHTATGRVVTGQCGDGLRLC